MDCGAAEISRGTEEPATRKFWAPQFECASRSRIRDIQEEKLASMLPYLYEHSVFYRSKFNTAKLRLKEIKSLADLPDFPVTTKDEMAARCCGPTRRGEPTRPSMIASGKRKVGWFDLGNHHDAALVSLYRARSRTMGSDQRSRSLCDGRARGRHRPDLH